MTIDEVLAEVKAKYGDKGFTCSVSIEKDGDDNVNYISISVNKKQDTKGIEAKPFEPKSEIRITKRIESKNLEKAVKGKYKL